MVLADDDFHIHAKIVFTAQNLDDAAARGTGGGGPVSDLHVHDHAFQVLGSHGTILWADILTNDAMRSSGG